MTVQVQHMLSVQGKRAALRSATIMLRQPLQRLYSMQASDIDIYRKVTREKTQTMVRLVDRPAGGHALGCQAG
jgi:ATP-dependent protease ClpP protease subunit